MIKTIAAAFLIMASTSSLHLTYEESIKRWMEPVVGAHVEEFEVVGVFPQMKWTTCEKRGFTLARNRADPTELGVWCGTDHTTGDIIQKTVDIGI